MVGKRSKDEGNSYYYASICFLIVVKLHTYLSQSSSLLCYIHNKSNF